MFSKLIKIVLSTSILLSASSLQAAIVTYNFTGSIYESDSFINIGDTYSVNISWETLTDYSGGDAEYLGAITGFSGTVGSFSLIEPNYGSLPVEASTIVVGNNDPYDSVVFISSLFGAGNLGGIAPIEGFFLGLADQTGTALDNTALPTNLPNDGFDSFIGSSGFILSFSDTTEIQATVDSISAVSTVPVPAAVWLFGSGLIGLIGVARRKKA